LGGDKTKGMIIDLDLYQSNRPLRRCQARFPTPALEFRRYLTLITFATQYVIPLGISGLAYGAIVRRVFEFNHFLENQTKFHFIFFIFH
jgi:hypothetical protein